MADPLPELQRATEQQQIDDAIDELGHLFLGEFVPTDGAAVKRFAERLAGPCREVLRELVAGIATPADQGESGDE